MRATTPELMYQVLTDAFNAGDLEQMMTLYEADAALVAPSPARSSWARSRSARPCRASWPSTAGSARRSGMSFKRATLPGIRALVGRRIRA